VYLGLCFGFRLYGNMVRNMGSYFNVSVGLYVYGLITLLCSCSLCFTMSCIILSECSRIICSKCANVVCFGSLKFMLYRLTMLMLLISSLYFGCDVESVLSLGCEVVSL